VSRRDLEAPVPHVLREYALLADGERGILVGPRGDFGWMCFPRWDDDAVFASLLGGGGAYVVKPSGRFVWGGYYEHGTLIWRSRWVTDSGAVVESREALALPGDPGLAIVLRRVEVLAGTARIEMLLDPAGRFGADALENLRRGEDGRWTGHLGAIRLAFDGGTDVRTRKTERGGEALARDFDLEAGERRDLVLVLAHDDAGLAPIDPDACWRATESEWRARVPALDEAVGSRDARHAYATLSGLTSAAGGMVAAATTGLPERARGGRSYDYRYVWIRDQCYAGEAVARSGAHGLLDDTVRFVSERLLADGPRLSPAYTTRGERIPEERDLDLPGYPGGAAVVGNRVSDQFQLDPFGEALLLFAAAYEHDRLDGERWRAAELAADAIERRWTEPDAGIWELEPAEWTHSRLIAAAGLRAISACAPAGEQAPRWLALADRITADAAARAVHPSGRWQRTPEDERVDAALLLPSIRGAVSADDPRTLATLHAVEQELTEDGYAYRYRPDERPLGEAEGAFLLCGFLLSLAWSQQGDAVRAARWFERTRAASGPPGLLSEEFDVSQRQLRGNLPQAFVHALLIECAVTQSA
jgi:GH15 family glucan-1,4-alpha-glucosidase